MYSVKYVILLQLVKVVATMVIIVNMTKRVVGRTIAIPTTTRGREEGGGGRGGGAPAEVRLADFLEVRPVRRQLTRQRAGLAAEPRVVLVRAVVRLHDQLAVREKRVVRAVGVQVHALHRHGHRRVV